VSVPTRENIYAGPNLLATLQGTAVNYYTRDHLSGLIKVRSTSTQATCITHLVPSFIGS
jgi:hypothetical protein